MSSFSSRESALAFLAGAGAAVALTRLLSCRSPAPAESAPPAPAAAAAPKLKLVYFDIPGKAEPIRLAAAIGGVDMVDERLSFDDFKAKKAAGEFPAGQVPCLFVDGVPMCQSSAIVKYIGKLGGLYPVSDHLLAAKIDEILDCEIDLFTGLTVYRYSDRFGFGEVMDDANKAKVAQELNDQVLPKHLGFLEARLASSSTGWVADSPGPTVADLVLACRLSWLRDLDSSKDNLLAPFPKVTALIQRVLDLPAIKAYYAARNVA